VEDCRLILREILGRFSKAVLLLGFVVIGSVSAAQAQAQTPAPTSDSKTELKSSLSDLSNLYKSEVERLEKRHQQSQELYKDGLISRVELENGEKALNDARAKVEQVTKEIAAANQPAPGIGADAVFTGTASDQVWSTGNTKIDNLIRYYGAQYDVDPFLIYCTMSQESSFSAAATSPKGAQGLMQLMPDTAARYGVTNPFDVAQSIKGGTRYLKDLLKMFNGRVDLALAGYNAGEGAVMKYGNTIPPYTETRNYVRLILKRYAIKKLTS
jgi:soluble lytic murein transglycosylase-like protein